MWARLKRLGNAIYKPKERILAEKLAEGKIHIVTLQKSLIDEELHEKKLKVALLKEEMEHKRVLFNLQKQEMMLKIEEYKANLGTLKKEQPQLDSSEQK
ncbi:unnamed protein product [Arctia plantaginis]|uniref:Uncharacterized protein n=1 Tax=Arctia plantaginis TaxID=874455 RepID=A0A8S1B8B9_ARCPL|nr:unnamed protein product [Arctia plantaginis]CAB3258711.1 unnamed protein product [Arctia plantaginis]